MIFILGIICGISIAFVVFLGYISLALKGKNPVEKVVRSIEDKAKSKVQIFMPPTEEEASQEKVIQKNEREKRETTLEELGL